MDCRNSPTQTDVDADMLTTDATTTLDNSLILSRVDYCNSVLYGICEVHLRPLQSVLNMAARLITSWRKFDHITSTIRDDLHWPPSETTYNV